MQKWCFQGIFISFNSIGGMSENLLFVELIQHETCSAILLSSLQNISVFLYSNNVWFNQKIWISTIILMIFWDFLMFYQILFSPQVKRCVIITYKHGIYEVPHELPNNLRLRILGNEEISGKPQNPIEW